MSESVQRHEPREKSLARQGDFFAAVLESADALILVLDEGGHILQVNRAARRATGYVDEELRGREFTGVLPIREAATALSDGLRRLRAGEGAYSFECHWATRAGERLLVSGSLTPMRTADGSLSHVIVTASDVTKRRALEEELRALTLRDDMTGLFNRRGFALLAEQRLKESRRSGSSLAVFYADVDQLKAINDEFGHNAGDIALALCARALEATFRSSDIVARIGGDEFVALADADERELETVTTQLAADLERRTAESGLRFAVALTMGSACSRPPHALSLDEILAQADEFMYARKQRTPH